MARDEDLIALTPAHAGVAAALHKDAFDNPWSPDAFADLLAQPVVHGWILVISNPVGFILMRHVADESEILTLAVADDSRRRGYGRRLVEHALSHVAASGASVCHLEVATDNDAARRLYTDLGFNTQGQRKGYYGSPAGAKDAIMMSLAMK